MAVLGTGDLGLAVVALVIDGQARCDCRLGLKCPVCGDFARNDKCRIAKAHAELFPYAVLGQAGCQLEGNPGALSGLPTTQERLVKLWSGRIAGIRA